MRWNNEAFTNQPADAETKNLTSGEVEALFREIIQTRIAPTCEEDECGLPSVVHYYRDGRWRCERHFALAFREDFGCWPGEE